METGPMLTGIAVVLAVVLPILYLHMVQNAKTKRFLQTFMGLAQKQNLILGEHEIWNNNYAIGIDTRSNKLFYMKITNGKELTTVVDLAEIGKCRIANKHRQVKNSSDTIVDRLDLVLTNRNTLKPDTIIEFYSGEESLTLRGELPLIEKWDKIVRSHLQNKRQTVK